MLHLFMEAELIFASAFEMFCHLITRERWRKIIIYYANNILIGIELHMLQ